MKHASRMIHIYTETLIAATVNNPQYKLQDHWLILKVMKNGQAYTTIDNRRLEGFHHAQPRLINVCKINVTVRLYDWDLYHDPWSFSILHFAYFL
jgi:hypothetical protein